MADADAPQMTEAAKAALAKAKAGAENTTVASPAVASPEAAPSPVKAGTVVEVEVVMLKPGETGGKLTVKHN